MSQHITEILSLEALFKNAGQVVPAPMKNSPWRVIAIKSDDCMSYVAWHTQSQEALLIDPKREDAPAYEAKGQELTGYRWLAVIDTHTHADHVSCAGVLAKKWNVPLLMHQTAPSSQVDLRVCRDTVLIAAAERLRIMATPGHTVDSITVVWGPFVFAGDTVLYGDSGRDDLPGGSPEAHYESLVKLRELVTADAVLLPGHDHKGGRASLWSTQLEINASLTQGRDDFVRESCAFDAPAPKLLKESLRENFR
jgi:glyoxylase-like metal-dependent hydrolase (beta-lactamase superfamily II)